MKAILTVAASLALIYSLLVVFYAVMQRSLIYYPTTVSMEQAEQRVKALGGSPWLSDDGAWLGWKYTRGGAATEGLRPRALVFHGNAGMALDRAYYAALLSGLEASGPWEVYIHEHPGYGPRKGSAGELAFAAAAVNAADHLLAQSPEPLLVIGESIGSGVAAELVRQRPDAAAALLLITPFDSLVSVARHHMPYLPAGLLLTDRYNNIDALSGFHRPLIVITASEDSIVPAVLAEPLLQQHRGPLLHKVQTGAGHNSLHFNPRQAPWPAVDAFLADQLAGTSPGCC